MSKKIDPSRQTAMGLWTDAKEMLEAAKILARSGVHKVIGPTMYLLGHSLELAFKSFLLAIGKSHDDLKAIGHDLKRAMKSVVDAGLSEVYCLSEKDNAVVAMLNQYYQAKEFEYRVTGFKTYPTTDDLIGLLDGLLHSTEATCAKSIGAVRA
jgi:hypothetical protein